MASPTLNQPQAIADRSDVHKACRALESVVNVLNDYSEAARAVVTLQKKLTKALRDASGLKANGEIACNAFGTSASIFEVLSDINAKYAKIADKECDSVSGEVRKWFKKLAKEERAHDDKIASCNAKIKQAGQLYEKKAKKNTYDAAEEHNRYIALLSSLGPEITQERYNHSLMLSQRNTTITYNVAATVSRIADAEWLRATEGVRRFSPLVGQLGEWRSFCEGGWAGVLPEDLPDLDATSRSQDGSHNVGQDSGGMSTSPAQQSPPDIQAYPNSSSHQSDDLHRPTSLASLASFPSPPTHFPIPPIQSPSKPSTPAPSSPTQAHTSAPTQMKTRVESRAGSDIAPGATLAKVEEEKSIGQTTPALTDSSRSPASAYGGLATPPAAASLPLFGSQQRATLGLNLPFNITEGAQVSKVIDPSKSTESSRTPDPSTEPLKDSSVPDKLSLTSRESEPVAQSSNRTAPSSHPRANPSNPSSRTSSYAAGTMNKGDYLEERELGIDKSIVDAVKSKSLDSGRGYTMVERTDTVRSSGSVVATMKDRIGRSTGPASPPPRDLPRLQLSVTEIANKFQAPATADGTSSFRKPPLSPMEEAAPRRSYDVSESVFTRSVNPRPLSMHIDDLARRRQRVEEMEELERRERELEGRARDRERAMFEREARDRGNLRANEQTLPKREEEHWVEHEPRRGGFGGHRLPNMGPTRRDTQDDTLRSKVDGYASDTTRPYAHPPVASQRQYSQASTSTRGYENPSQAPSLASRYSYSTTNLAAPPRGLPFPSNPTSANREATRPVSPSRPHDPSCQCPACTVERYSESPLTLPPPPEREKKGWRRRLSMPVVISPFSSEARKDKGIMGGKGIGVGITGQQNSSVTSFGRR
ncbi:hypothetical protein OF83DRAFT_1092804 [Amylostereum chailletii]|nr:hypothetical protein OF83DRAFT_1092804 [Amylostereum chailletii]